MFSNHNDVFPFLHRVSSLVNHDECQVEVSHCTTVSHAALLQHAVCRIIVSECLLSGLISHYLIVFKSCISQRNCLQHYSMLVWN